MGSVLKFSGAPKEKMKATADLPKMPRTRAASRRGAGELPEAMSDLDLDPGVDGGISSTAHYYVLSINLRGFGCSYCICTPD